MTVLQGELPYNMPGNYGMKYPDIEEPVYPYKHTLKYYFMKGCKKEARAKGKARIIHNCQLASDAVHQKSRDFMKANYALQSFMLSTGL